jgi:polysaccharide pyruvyl transferase WcaK-like protein
MHLQPTVKKGAILRSSSRADVPRVLILHAYSPTNSGDGLLVDLALQTLHRTIGEFSFHVVASDADGFDDERYIQWGVDPSIRFAPGRRLSMLATGVVGAPARVKSLAEEADLIVAVGGAYLRGGGFVESLKSWGAHYGQVKLAAQHGSKSVYFPQSIGPFTGVYRRMMNRHLGQIGAVYVRDEKSLQDWGHLVGVNRAPDMAILEWARGYSGASPLSGDGPVFVARDLPRPRTYESLLNSVRDSGRYEWAVQATGGGNDDFPITRRMSPTAPRLLSSVLAEARPRVVVSTRLHGSLSSLIAGYPSVHLSYERKGWSAFADLGLSDFVIAARDATLDEVDELVNRITRDPGEYWARLEDKVNEIGQADRAIEVRVREALKVSLDAPSQKVGGR